MDGQLESPLEGNVGSKAVGDEASAASKSEVIVARGQTPEGSNQGAPSRRQRASPQGLGRVAVTILLFAFTIGILLGIKLPRWVQTGIPFQPQAFEDPQEQQLQWHSPYLPLSPKDKVALNTSGVRDASPSFPQLPPYDGWGLPFLSHFEQTLSSRLRRGREEVSFLLQKSCLGNPQPEYIGKTEKILAKLLSGGTVDELAGITVTVTDVKPIKPNGSGREGLPVQRSFSIKRVLRVGYPRILMEVQDLESGDHFALRVRAVASRNVGCSDERKKFVDKVKQWEELEEAIARQASCGTPGDLVGMQKGLSVPLYVGTVTNFPNATIEDNLVFFSHVQIFQSLHGEFDFGSLITAGLSVRAKEYIASRLLQIALKVQEALLSHNGLSWSNIYANPDGSFVLSGFDACTPLGKAAGMLVSLRGKYLEPTLRLEEHDNAAEAVPQAQSDLWSLGMLLYELFTGELPYSNDESDFLHCGVSMARYLIDEEVEPVSLVPDLDAANCPDRWKRLIVGLLHPVRGARLTAWDILIEFPDLVGHRLPR